MNDDEHHRKRCKRYNLPGHAHYLTFSCFRRRPFLARDRARNWLLESIDDTLTRHNLALFAWVFMPEHVHLLIFPRRPDYSIARILTSIKLPVSQRAANWVTENAPAFLVHMLDEQPNGTRAVRFWQRGGGYDRNTYSADEIWEKIHYIHQNPVRRGLVAKAEDWEWSSVRDYMGGRGKLPVDKRALPEGW